LPNPFLNQFNLLKLPTKKSSNCQYYFYYESSDEFI